MLQPNTLHFLEQLALNNAKEWFDANRKTYEQAKLNFLQLTQQVLQGIAHIDASVAHLQAKECVFRINRDVRFSQNKAPYKTNMGMSIAKGGKKGISAGYYFHLQPGNQSFVGGGLYMAMPEEIKKVRQEIDYCFTDWQAIIQAPPFVQTYGKVYTGADVSLVRPPKGYEPTHPAIEYLKLKSWIATQPISDEVLLQATLPQTIVQAFAALQPMVQFLNNALEQ